VGRGARFTVPSTTCLQCYGREKCGNGRGRSCGLLLFGAAGCAQVTCISLTPEANMAAVTYGHQLCLRHVDMSDCCRLDDAGLQLVVTYCPAIVQLYVRRCPRVTDLGRFSSARTTAICNTNSNTSLKPSSTKFMNWLKR